MINRGTQKFHRRRYTRRSRASQQTVEVTWPLPWHDLKGGLYYSNWSSCWFRPGPKALAQVCARAIRDRVPIDVAVRCAEAAGLFRKGHRPRRQHMECADKGHKAKKPKGGPS